MLAIEAEPVFSTRFERRPIALRRSKFVVSVESCKACTFFILSISTFLLTIRGDTHTLAFRSTSECLRLSEPLQLPLSSSLFIALQLATTLEIDISRNSFLGKLTAHISLWQLTPTPHAPLLVENKGWNRQHNVWI